MPPLKYQKQEKFVLNYFQTGNATNAAIMAGYSKKTACKIASENLTKPDIRSRLTELQEKAESAKVASVIERKQILSEILRAKLPDFMELGADGSWVNIGPETVSGHAIQEIHSRTEYDEDGSKPTVYTSVKLHDPIRAIQELNKMEKVYDDSPKVNILNQTIIQNNLSTLSDEELETLERIVTKTTLIGTNQTGESPKTLN
jgi:phage terminase small subunit